jgi:hypothetical protein
VKVEPTEREAQGLVASAVLCWLAGAVTFAVEPIALVAFVLAFIAMFNLYRILFTAGGREADCSPVDVLRFGRGRPKGSVGWTILLKLLDPLWWRAVVRRTGWPTAAATAILVGSLAVLMISMVISPAPSS